ncbi:MAG: peptidase dimerization domain-containing protein [Pseudonocardiaceae bacterium]
MRRRRRAERRGRGDDRLPRDGHTRHRRTRRIPHPTPRARKVLALRGSTPTPNAIEKAAHLTRALSALELPDGATDGFPLPGKLTVTAITGGHGYSVTPDLCTINVDIRTTPGFDDPAVAALLERTVAEVDRAWPDTRPTLIDVTTRWPAFALPADSPLRATMIDAAAAFGVDTEPKIAGPSNIGNYLAGLDIPATAGFGVIYTGLHATDERFRTDTAHSPRHLPHRAAAVTQRAGDGPSLHCSPALKPIDNTGGAAGFGRPVGLAAQD